MCPVFFRKRFNPLRTKFDAVWPKFIASGNGEGGRIVDEEGAYTMQSSTFWNFCNGDISLYYFYSVCVNTGILKSAASKMDADASHSSESGGSSTSAQDHRPGSDHNPKSADGAAPVDGAIHIGQTEDQREVVKSKRLILELKAKSQKEETTAALMTAYEVALEKLESHQFSPKFLEGSFHHQLLQSRITALEVDLSSLTGVKNDTK